MGGNCIDISGNNLRLYFINRNPCFAFAMVHGIKKVKKFPCAFAISDFRKGHYRPDSCVRILPSIFAHSWCVAFDIARVESGLVKGRVEQLNDTIVTSDEPLINSVHRLANTIRLASSANSCPALGERIELTFEITMLADSLAAIKVCSSVPLPIPCVELNIFLGFRMTLFYPLTNTSIPFETNGILFHAEFCVAKNIVGFCCTIDMHQFPFVCGIHFVVFNAHNILRNFFIRTNIADRIAL